MDRLQNRPAINALLRTAIEQALAEKGMSARAASEAVVGHDGLIRDIKRGNVPTADKLAGLAEVLGLEFYFGPRRHPTTYVEKREQKFLTDDVERLANPLPIVLSDSNEAAATPSAQYAALPLHEVELAAGAGALNDSETIGRHLLFRQDWMRKLGLTVESAHLARVRGDSMLPLLSDSDLVLVDLSQTELAVEQRKAGAPRRPHLFAIEQEGESRVKWVERPDDATLVLYSENAPLYRPEIYVGADAERIRLVGRVVWWCHTVPSY